MAVVKKKGSKSKTFLLSLLKLILVVAVIGGIGFSIYYLNNIADEVSKIEVYRAITDITKDTEFNSSKFEKIKIDAMYVNSDMVTNLTNLEDTIFIKDLKKDSFLYKSDVSDYKRTIKANESIFATSKANFINMPDTLRKNDMCTISVIDDQGKVIDTIYAMAYYVKDAHNREVYNLTSSESTNTNTSSRDIGTSSINKVEWKVTKVEEKKLYGYIVKGHKFGITRDNNID